MDYLSSAALFCRILCCLKDFFQQKLCLEGHPVLWQRVGDSMFAEVIKNEFEVPSKEIEEEELSISHQELNALQYAAGYIPRDLLKKLKKSASPVNCRLVKCLLNLFNNDEDQKQVHDESEEWLNLVDRGGLMHVNKSTSQAILVMEVVLRRHLHTHQMPPNFKEVVSKEIHESEEVTHHWSLLADNWEEDDSQLLFEMVVDLFVTMRGFSYASAWIEEYKAATANTLQKSKGIRKGLLKPSSCLTSDPDE